MIKKEGMQQEKKLIEVVDTTSEKGTVRIKESFKQIVQKDLNLLNQLISILQNHCGERGDNEGATETLKRIIKERDERLDKQKVRDTINNTALQHAGKLYIPVTEFKEELGL